MIRKIVRIDEEKCNGCGICVNACHEGALQMIDGKARLVSDDYCDGLGACLPECPTGAITIEEREANAFDEQVVAKAQEKKAAPKAAAHPQGACGCPGSQARMLSHTPAAPKAKAEAKAPTCESMLRQWPVQIQLVPASAPYFDDASLLIAADCTAYAYAGFHNDFMQGKITLIGCPKLDDADYSEKLAEILRLHDIKDITVLRMEVPCCGGIVNAVKKAIVTSGNIVPWHVVVIGTDGRIVSEQ